MRPTKFSGPVLYSGQAINSGSFTDMPIGFNPDFFHKFDDFLTKTIDTTNDYSFTALSSGTVEIYNNRPASGFPSADMIAGWALIESEPGDPTALSSGGILYTNEFVQPVRQKRPLLAEAKIGISDPINSSFFYGLNSDALNLTTSTRVGFELKSDGSGEFQAVAHYVLAGNPDEVRVDTGVIMDPMSVHTGAAGGSANILSIRIINIGSNNYASGPRAHFYIDRVLVATITQVSLTQAWPISSAIFQPSIYYRKDTEVTGMEIDDAIANGTDDGPYTVSGLPTKGDRIGETGGSGGLYGGQIIRVDSEDIKLGLVVGLGVGTATISEVERGVNSTTPVSHSAGVSISAAVGGCFIDYTSTMQARYPAGIASRNYMISPEPKG